MNNVICILKVDIFYKHNKKKRIQYLVVVKYEIKVVSLSLFKVLIKNIYFECTNIITLIKQNLDVETHSSTLHFSSFKK